MVGTNLRSRSNRRRKKRKNNRNLMIFLALAFLFFTILLSLIVLNKNIDSEVEQKEPSQEKEVTENETETENKKDTNETETEKDMNEIEEDEEEKINETEESEEDSPVSVKELDPEEINDSNVEKAFVGEWSPIGTSQKGSHTTNYSNGSQDRIEIKKAISAVTKVDEDNMVEWRVENGGDQKVIATVSDDNETQYYRVYLTWVDDQGWQVNKLEDLKQNDKK